MWGVVQSSVSELDFDFTEYADKHFKRLTETGADPRFAPGSTRRVAVSRELPTPPVA